MKRRVTNTCSGTTLVEMIIYLAISAVLITGVGVVSTSVIDAKSKTKATGDVYGTATNIVATIDRITKDGTLLTSPQFQSSSSTLIVIAGGVSTSSTSIYLSAGTLYLKAGTSTAQAINGSEVKVSSISFFAVGASTSTAVRTTFGLAASTTGVWREFQFSETFTMTNTLGNYR